MALRETIAEYEPIDFEEEVALTRSISLFAEPVTEFTVLERQVIALARTDTLASLEPPSWLDRLMAWAFGLEERSAALADARLEALRRAVVVTRHRHHMPDATAATLRATGFSAGQVRLAEALAITG